jgi:hypothetical protein
MSESPDQSDKLGVCYEALMPVAVTLLSAEPTSYEVSQAQQSNQTVLQTISALEESVERNVDEAERGSEIARLELKLNILLDLVSEIASRNLELPPQRVVRLCADRLLWPDDGYYRAGEALRVDLYLQPGYPRPLQLLGVLSEQRHQEGESVWAQIELSQPEEMMTDAMERFIFRQHRRQIALQRHPK